MLKRLWGVGLVQWGKNSPGFDPQVTAMHMWLKFIGSLLCSESFSLGNPVFPSHQKPAFHSVTWFILIFCLTNKHNTRARRNHSERNDYYRRSAQRRKDCNGNDCNEFIKRIFYFHIQTWMRFTRNRYIGEIGHLHVQQGNSTFINPGMHQDFQFPLW